MDSYVPSVFFLFPGAWARAQDAVSVLQDAGLPAQLRDGQAREDAVVVDLIEDNTLPEAFGFSRAGPLPDDVHRQVATIRSAALVEVGGRLDEAKDRVIAVSRAFHAAQSPVVRVEASGGTSTLDGWLERLESDNPALLYDAAVIIGQDADGFYTCGMHVFDLPDVQVNVSEPQVAVEWLDTLCIFQLAERPGLASGHTFRPHEQTARRKIERWPDHRHAPDDGRHNPFGIWRVLPEGDKGLESMSLIPTIIPPLVAVLANAESAQGRPLTPQQVDSLVNDAAAVTMEVKDAQQLERSRGYADIEPRRAWDQWQIVRTTFD